MSVENNNSSSFSSSSSSSSIELIIGSALSTLGHSLQSQSSSNQSKQQQHTCIITLLRILDNILSDPNRTNVKVRKIKVNENGPFYKRCGLWNGSIDFLLGCGFVSPTSSNNKNIKQLLKLENENTSRLLFGRNELIKFAVDVIKMDVGTLPACPTTNVIAGGIVIDDKEVAGFPEEEEAEKKKNLVGIGGNGDNVSDMCKRKSIATTKTTLSSGGSKTTSFDKKSTPTDPERCHNDHTSNDIVSTAAARNDDNNNNSGESVVANSRLMTIPTNPSNQNSHLSHEVQQTDEQQQSKKPGNSQLIKQAVRPAVPVVANSFSLEHIQMLTIKERQESIIEAKRLKDEEMEERQTKLVMEQQRLVNESEQRERRMIELHKRRQEEEMTVNQQRTQPTTATSSDEQQQQHMKSNKPKAQSDSPNITANNNNNISTLKITTSAASSLDPALSDEMTDLLDEIENELNDDWFDESPDKEEDDDFKNDNNNDDGDNLDNRQAKDGPGYYVDPSTDTASLCEHENEELIGEGPDVENNINLSSKVIATTSENAGNGGGEEGQIRPSMSEPRRVRLEQKHVEEKRGVVADAELGGNEDDNDTNNHDGMNSDVNNSATEPPMHLPETVEKLVESSTALENIPPPNSGVSEGVHHGSIVVAENTPADMTANGHDMNKSASDLLDDLESDSVVANSSTAAGSNSVHPIDVENEKIISQDRTSIDVVSEQYELSSKSTVEEVRNKSATEMEVENESPASTADNGPAPDSHSNDFTSHSPLDSQNNGYSDLFKNIPLPEGEFSSSDNDEDVRKFCHGFELCHRSLFSIWSTTDTCVDTEAMGKNTSTSSRYCNDTITAGLPNIIRIRLIWEDESNDTIQKPVILVPLVYVYTTWACILGLNSSHTSNRAGVQQGKMYSWLVSNHQQLSVFDDITVSESLNEFTHLPEASIAVCNYVCKALRDIGLVSMYRAEVNNRGATSQSNLFVGIDSDVFNNCIQKQEEGNALDKWLLHDCHGTLAKLVYPRILDGIGNNNNNHDTQASNLVWYSCRHAVRHLIASDRLNESKSLLFDTSFIRLRLQILGVLGGTVAHCRDCSSLDVCIAESVDEWRRNQLQAADMKRGLSSIPLDDYGNHDPAVARAPDVAGWKEDHFKILCSVSEALHEKAGEVSSNNDHHFDESGKCNLQKDIGNSMQMIGECIGDIGVYRPQEMEHYEESLRLKSEAYGDVDHPDIADILYIKGVHHQKFRHFKFAQKCYEQALRIYKNTLGYEHPCVARVLHNIGIMYHAKKDNVVALKCLKKSLSIRLDQLGENDLSVADSYCWIGKINREKKSFSKARECFMAAHRIKVEVLGKAHIESAEVLHNIGIVCDDLGLHSASLSCFREALLIRLANISGAYDINGINDVCETLDCIANVYRVKGEHEKALQFFEQCLKRRVRIVSASLSDKNQVSLLLRTYEDVISLTKIQLKESVDKDEIAAKIGPLLVEMGTLYDHRLNKQSKALIYLQKALQVFQQMKDYEQIGNTLSLIGVIHVKKSAHEKALKCFTDSLVMRKMASPNIETVSIAETMHNIGNCEARDGRFDSSLRSYGEALRIKKMIFPDRHISIAKTEHCMGLAMLQLGNLDDALEYFEPSLKVRRALLGGSHLDVSFSLHSLGKIHFHQNKVDEAIACLEEALKIKESKLSEKHMSLAETKHLLGSLYVKKKNFESAIALLKSALIAYRGSRDCEIMKSDVLDLLGNAYANIGEQDYAILSYEKSLKIKTVVVGSEATPCANVLMELGKLKFVKGDVDGALVAFKEVKRIQKILYKKDHLKNADLLIQVGLVQDSLNNNEMALRCFVEALRMRRKLLAKNHRDIAEALVHVGRMHQSKNNHFNSLAFFQEAIEIYRESDGDSSSHEYASACRLLGLSQIASGDSDNALFSLERCLELQELSYGSESEQWADVAYDLGIAKGEAGLYEDAIMLLDKFVLLQKRFENGDAESLSNALLSLGKIYLKKRSVDNAMVCFDEALGIRKQLTDNELGLSEVLFQIGGVRESKKQYLESLVCYEESLKLRLSVSGEDEDTADIVARIGEVRRIRGQFDLALENFNLALDMYKNTVGEAHLSVADTYHSLGYVCDAKNDVQKAMQNHKEGLSVRKLILGGDHVKVAASLDDVAGLYQKQNEHTKALRCLKEALRIRKIQLGNDDIEIGKTLFGMGIIFAAIDDNEKATECYNASLEISSRVGSHPKLEAQTLHQIGCLNAANCNYREALQNWRTCLSKYREGGLKDDHYMVACTLGNIEMAENVLNT